jgi:hypothetical protein
MTNSRKMSNMGILRYHLLIRAYRLKPRAEFDATVEEG